jgi:hypothetical protein
MSIAFVREAPRHGAAGSQQPEAPPARRAKLISFEYVSS